MLTSNKILAIIPARSGSKGLPKKNIYPLKRKPLIAWSIEAGLQSRYIDRLILSSNDEEIIKIAQQYDCDVPFIRPDHLALDTTPGIDPILHGINEIKGYDYVLVLQPTSPLRTHTDIDQCIEHCLQHKAPACVSICQTEKHPYWMYTKDPQGTLFPLFPGEEYLRRQELPNVYHLNGALYFAHIPWLTKHKTFLSPETIGFEMSATHSVDIDTKDDINKVEYILRHLDPIYSNKTYQQNQYRDVQ